MIDEKKLVEEIDNLDDDCVLFHMRNGKKQKAYWINMVNDQPKVGEWIQVSERLPDAYAIGTKSEREKPQYLILRNNGLCEVATYEHIYTDVWIAHAFVYDDVIAWMLLLV